MSHAVVLALTPQPDGEGAADAPAALAGDDPGDGPGSDPGDGPGDGPGDERPALLRTVAQLREHGAVSVLTWTRWAEPVRQALPDDVDIVAVDDPVAALRWLAAPPDGPLAVLHGHLVADDLALGRIADRAARGTAALVGPIRRVDHDLPQQPTGDAARPVAPARVARGRITAAGSSYHRVAHPTHLAVGALRVAAADTAELAAAADELAALLDGGPPPAWRAQLDAPDADLVALLLVALVRRGVHLAATGLPRGSVWRWCRTARELADARAALAEQDLERVRLDNAVKAEDGFFTTFFVSSYSRFWARWAARRGLTPDQVTSVSMLLGIAAAAAFAAGVLPGFVAGAVLLQLAFTLDCVDGQLARYTRRFTTRGAWLDAIFDRGKEYVVLAGLAVGGIRAGDDATLWLLAGAVLALQTFRHTLDLGYAEQQLADIDREVRRPLPEVGSGTPAFWEAVPGDVEVVAAPASDVAASSGVAAGARGAVRALRRAEDVAALKWAKRIVVLPIGERFALISVLAIVTTPRVVFLALLVWGGLATLYTFGGRLVRSVA